MVQENTSIYLSLFLGDKSRIFLLEYGVINVKGDKRHWEDGKVCCKL